MKRNTTWIKIVLSVILCVFLLNTGSNIVYYKRLFDFRPLLIFLLGIVKNAFTKSHKSKLEIFLTVFLIYVIGALYIDFLMPSNLRNALISSGMYTVIFFVAGECIGNFITNKEK